MDPAGPRETFSNESRLRSKWEGYGRRCRRYRGGCLATAVVGLALIFLGVFWPGVAVVTVAVGTIAWQDLARRERADWQLLGEERTREFAEIPQADEDEEGR